MAQIVRHVLQSGRTHIDGTAAEQAIQHTEHLLEIATEHISQGIQRFGIFPRVARDLTRLCSDLTRRFIRTRSEGIITPG